MNPVLWLLLGGLLGWVSSRLMRWAGQRGTAFDMIVGMAGAFAGGELIAPWVGVPSVAEQELNLPALGVALLGAVVVLGLVNALVRRRLLR